LPFASILSVSIHIGGEFIAEDYTQKMSEAPRNDSHSGNPNGQIFRYDVAMKTATQLSLNSPIGNNFVPSDEQIYGGSIINCPFNSFFNNSALWLKG
jgi:hypothetical protein